MNGLFADLRNEFAKANNAVVKLILLNLLIFVSVIVLRVIFYYGSQAFVYAWVMQNLSLPADFRTFLYRPWTLLTNFFVHEGIWHIVFNMLFLYWFGKLLEEYLGTKRLVGLYILGGLAGGTAFLLLYNFLPYFQSTLATTTLVGASGAIFAVIVGAATLLPNYTFFLLFIGPVRLKYIAAFYILLSMAELVGPNAGGNLAHLAGALVGFGFIRALRSGYDWGMPVYAIGDFLSSVFVRKPAPRVPQRARTEAAPNKRPFTAFNNESAPVAAPSQEEVDAILDKISRSGYESLSREEKQKLYKASQ
jgi:membrane associated rhomboid family serine protease